MTLSLSSPKLADLPVDSGLSSTCVLAARPLIQDIREGFCYNTCANVQIENSNYRMSPVRNSVGQASVESYLVA